MKLNQLGIYPSLENSVKSLHLCHPKEFLWQEFLLVCALLPPFEKKPVKINTSKIVKSINLPEKGYHLTSSRNGHSKKEEKLIKPIRNFVITSDFTQKVPPQYDITRSKERTGREREMHGHEIFKAEPRELADRKKNIKAFCKYSGPDIGISAIQSYSFEFSGAILFTTA